jgi:hypothetical protein
MQCNTFKAYRASGVDHSTLIYSRPQLTRLKHLGGSVCLVSQNTSHVVVMKLLLHYAFSLSLLSKAKAKESK